MIRKSFFGFIAAGLLLNLSVVEASYVGAVSAATGGAGSAAIESSDTPFLNPAGLGHLKGYFFTSSASRANQGVNNQSDMAFSLIDNMADTVVPTAVSYAQANLKDDSENQYNQKQFRLSFGNLVQPKIAFGLALIHEQNRFLDKSLSDTNLTMGTIWSPRPELGFALLFENMLLPNQEIDQQLRPEQKVTLGTTAHYKRLIRFRLDLTARLEDQMAKPILAAGLENFINRFTILRFGYQKDAREEANLLSAGFGFVLPRFGLHYAYQQSPQKETLTRHSVDLAVPIW